MTALFCFLLQSPFFVVKSVRVLGASGPLAEQIAQQAGIAGVNLFALNPAQVQARLAGIPDLQDVAVRLHLPNSLTIQVTTYQPAAVWISGGAPYLITADGFVIKPGSVDGLVRLSSASGPPLHHGDRIDPNAVRAALALGDLLTQQRLEASQYTYVDDRSLQVTSPAGWQATFDVSGDLAGQVRVLAALLAQGVPFHSVDLRYGDTPYYR